MPRPVSNPPNPWSSAHVEWLGEPPAATLDVFEEEAERIVSDNDSPDLGFRHSVNPYRGCYHGCAYCYARPSHQYLGFGAGTDFDRKIVVKVNAPERLRATFAQRSWQGELIVFSGNTDCYQPLEAAYRLTRRCLEVALEFRNPVGIITKGALVVRDIDVLVALWRCGALSRVTLSIPFADDALGRAIEPYASRVAQRLETLGALSQAGLPTGISVAPVIPGLNDQDIPTILERAAHAGARHASMIPLRLPAEVLPVFTERVAAVLSPERVRKVSHTVREMRGGKMNEAGFGARMTGLGPRWQAVAALFAQHVHRLGLNQDSAMPSTPSPFRRPTRQCSLFGD